MIPTRGTDSLVARLREPGALVVTTGQQPGLFTGPVYAVTKALSARGLALALEAHWKRPVIAVYWIPGDDHDWHEVNHVSWLGAEGDLVSVALPERPADAALTPMWRQPLGPEVLPALERFEQSFPPTPERLATVEWLRRHYRSEATVAGAYGAALAELLAPFGVLCLDSSHRVVKQATSGLLLQALDRSAAIERELNALATTLTSTGSDPGVTVGEGGTPVFLDGVLGRDRLLRSDSTGTFVLRRQHTTVGFDEVRRIAADEPTRLSGNVLLRPVLESAVLPTVAYLAGPADYTTMVFGERRADSTWAHQIATAAIFNSPVLVFGAHPQAILDHPAILGLIGSLLGIPLGIGLAYLGLQPVQEVLRDIFMQLEAKQVEVSAEVIGLALVAGTLTAVLAALIPAIAASSENPAEAVRRIRAPASYPVRYSDRLVALQRALEAEVAANEVEAPSEGAAVSRKESTTPAKPAER